MSRATLPKKSTAITLRTKALSTSRGAVAVMQMSPAKTQRNPVHKEKRPVCLNALKAKTQHRTASAASRKTITS